MRNDYDRDARRILGECLSPERPEGDDRALDFRVIRKGDLGSRTGLPAYCGGNACRIDSVDKRSGSGKSKGERRRI